RALEKAPAERFTSLEEMRRMLAAIPVEPVAVDRRPSTVDSPEAEAAPVERYVITTELDGGLVQATDTKLGREVVIEVLPADAPHLHWLRAIARWAGARLQRVLRLEPAGDGTIR